jgi:hypothetical protein
MVASLGLPHWLMIAGTLLVVAGFVGVLVSGKKAKELESSSDEPTDASHQQMPPLPSLLDSAQGTTPSHWSRAGPGQTSNPRFRPMPPKPPSQKKTRPTGWRPQPLDAETGVRPLHSDARN